MNLCSLTIITCFLAVMLQEMGIWDVCLVNLADNSLYCGSLLVVRSTRCSRSTDRLFGRSAHCAKNWSANGNAESDSRWQPSIERQSIEYLSAYLVAALIDKDLRAAHPLKP